MLVLRLTAPDYSTVRGSRQRGLESGNRSGTECVELASDVQKHGPRLAPRALVVLDKRAEWPPTSGQLLSEIDRLALKGVTERALHFFVLGKADAKQQGAVVEGLVNQIR